jgi:hypothetical protein
MNRVKANTTISLDRFDAGPGESDKDPLGIGGEQLHQCSHICYRRTSATGAMPTVSQVRPAKGGRR